MRKIKLFFELVKFEHTIFALPFAYLGMILAARGWPTAAQLGWITLAMIGARTLAMSLNRLIDWQQDAANPRTTNRPLPRGLLHGGEVVLLSLVSVVVFLFSAWQLNDLCLKLAPVAILVLGIYSYTKRFTWLSHWVLGLADGIAPVGGWLAVTGRFSLEPIILGLAVGTWICGFDLIYACQDVEFDRSHGLYSIPANFSVGAALALSRLMHSLTAALLVLIGVMMSLSWPYWVGWAAAVALLTYEQSLVHPHDLSNVNLAFFNVNGYIAAIVFVFTAAAVLIF